MKKQSGPEKVRRDRSWDVTHGRLYTAGKLEKSGVTMTEDLITFIVTVGKNTRTVYPGGQFRKTDDGTLVRREPVISFWNEVLKPDITGGSIYHNAAAALLLQPQGEFPDGHTLADVLDSPYPSAEQTDEVRNRVEALLLEARIEASRQKP
jgi:hypothetical protein